MKKDFILLILSFFSFAVWSQPSIDKKLRDNIADNKIISQTSWEYKYSGDQPGSDGIRTSATKFNTSGDATEITTYNPKGIVMNIEKYRYDGAGNKLEYSRFSGGNESQVAYQKISTYDTNNNVTEEKGFDGV